MVFKKCVRVLDENHRFAPQYDENDTITVPCENVLTAIGQKALWGGLLDGSKAVLRGNGTVEADPVTLQTTQPDIFAGGDIYHGARFAIDAIDLMQVPGYTVVRHSCSRLHVSGRETEKLWPR